MAEDAAPDPNNNNGQGQNQQQDDNGQELHQEQPPRVRRTHVSEEAIQILSSLSLYNKLEMNKNIEQANQVRSAKTALHVIDSVRNPIPGSDQASMITIDEIELTDLLDDNIRDRFKDVIPISIIKWISEVQKATGESQMLLKRPHSSLDNAEKSHEAKMAKRRCMSGDDLVPRIEDAPVNIIFPQIMFDTEDCMQLPMSCFSHRALHYIINHLAMLDTVKANPLDGTSKGLRILDIAKLCAKTEVGDELSLDHSEWTEAAWQMFRFQQERDRDGPAGKFAGWYSKHFNFFNIQIDKVASFNAWKHLELELRQEFRSQRKEYNAAHYANRYALAKSEAKSTAENAETKAQVASLQQIVGKMQGFPPRGGSSTGRFSRPGNSSTLPPSPFPSSSSKTAPPACCILCGQRGHTLSSGHSNDTAPQKSVDGKPTFATYSNRILKGPDNKEICVRYNLKGDRAECLHPKDERAHVCSFCGKGHYAFSWTCRSKPNV